MGLHFFRALRTGVDAPGPDHMAPRCCPLSSPPSAPLASPFNGSGCRGVRFVRRRPQVLDRNLTNLVIDDTQHTTLL